MTVHGSRQPYFEPISAGAAADELLSEYHFDLPQDSIAQVPSEHRDGSRLLSCWRNDGSCRDLEFSQLADQLEPGDLVVVNDTRVLAARLFARKESSGGRVEVLLIEPRADDSWAALVRPSAKVPPGSRVVVERRGEGGSDAAPVLVLGEVLPNGSRAVRCGEADPGELAGRWGEMPLPPYIDRSAAPMREDSERYQTIFARDLGAVAAPTAGLHFTPQTLSSLRERGIQVASITLHVGPGTFQPVRSEQLSDHVMHNERYCVPAETARRISQCQSRDGRIVAVGTTTCRSLESWHRLGRPADGLWRTTDLFLRPGYGPTMDLGLLTNFHLPCSSLVMLVAAFMGRENTLHLYRRAAEKGYRFYSYGDAMLIL